MALKQMEAKKVTVGENSFHIKPFPAFKAVFPKQKDIKKQPMFTCLQTKEYCY